MNQQSNIKQAIEAAGLNEKHARVLKALYQGSPATPSAIRSRTRISRHDSRVRAILEHLERLGLAEFTPSGWQPAKPVRHPAWPDL